MKMGRRYVGSSACQLHMLYSTDRLTISYGGQFMSANNVLRPPNFSDVQTVVWARTKAAEDHAGVQETMPVEWRGKQLIVPVITMPVELLYFNPGTHRIRAQRTVDPERNQALDQDPFGDIAQRYLHSLLAGDPTDPAKEDTAFLALKEDLKTNGQADPGIITQDGVLINGNTRCAALRDLGAEHIRVGVLPPDAGMEDLQSIELSLQLRKDLKRDYTFMNFLLAIDDRLQANRPPASIQKDFRIRPETYDRAVWILGFVREAIKRSTIEVNGGQGVAALTLIDFEGDQGKLEELWRAYVTLKRKSSDEAEALREQRLLALILGKSKTDLRLIEADFADRYMEKSVQPTPEPAAPKFIPGTNIPVPPQSAKVTAMRNLTDEVLKAVAVQKASGSATAAEVEQAAEAVKEIDRALEDGLEQAGKTGRIVKKRFGPVDRLSDANEDLSHVIKAVAESKGTGNFVAEDLDSELQETRSHLMKLAQMVGRPDTTDCDGLQWLLDIATRAQSDS